MNYINERIKCLEQELKELKCIQEKINKNDFLNVKINLTVESFDDNLELNFNSFHDVFEYFKSIKQKDDKIALDYCIDNVWHNQSFYDCKKSTCKNIIGMISTFDAYKLSTMDFGVCTKKDSWKCQCFIRTPFMIKYDNKNSLTKEEYEKIIKNGKKYRIF
jgi:hypothetical protein